VSPVEAALILGTEALKPVVLVGRDRRRVSLTAAAVVAGLVLGVPAGLAGQPAAPGAQRPGALPPTIPLFPLPDVTLFPNATRPLHIFEFRYRAMVADALKGDRIIGMVLLRPGYEADYDGRPPVYPIGCAGVITAVEELPDGRYLILLQGLVKFRVKSEGQRRPYRLARVDALPETPDEEEKAALGRLRQRLTTLLAAAAPGSAPPPPGLSDEDLVNIMAQQLDLDPMDRQDLLERDGPLARSRALIELLESR
jgi:hypothetical protein